MSLATTNPYTDHPQLSDLESEVLWEYAKLADTIQKIGALARRTAESPNESLLLSLRELETKMKLVFTTFQTSVFLINQEHNLASEDAAQQQKQQQQHHEHHDEGHSEYPSYAQYDTTEGDSTIQY